MKSKLCFSLIIIIIPSLLGTATAFSLGFGTGGSEGESQFSGNYNLDASSELSISTSLASGSLFKETKAKGSGFNSLDEYVFTKDNSVQNTIVGLGSLSMSSLSYGSGQGVAVYQDSGLTGDIGFIGTKSISAMNQFMIAGGFYGKGDLTQHIHSSSGDISSVDGTVSSAGVDLLNDQISQALSSGDKGMSIDGISNSDGEIGKFSLVAVNQAGKGSPPTPPTGTAVSNNPLTHTSDPAVAGEIMDSTDPKYVGSSSSYTFKGWKINSPLQLYLRQDSYLAGESLNPEATGKAIATAAATWESSTSKDLFSGTSSKNPDVNVIVSANVAADKHDGYSVHAFSPISGSGVAYARTWTSKKVVVESDVVYSTRYNWASDWTQSNLKDTRGRYISLDVQSVALHELGHAVGLGDLYTLRSSDPRYKDWCQIMNLYNGPQRYLGAGDKTGLQLLYGS